MKGIPIYADGWVGGLGLPRYDSWKLSRWLVGDGESIKHSAIVAELECEAAVIELEVFYRGTLHQRIAQGESFSRSEPIGFIRCSDEEYAEYLQSENARRICISLEPGELREVESLKGGESNEDFVTRVFRAGLSQFRPAP
ncbi:hypothetical protein [Luteolibacter marinus]|uniref:hypothetical protein n=1 Tax=Luteolibacter marinus TaxID=2776705 RepID=UPI0018663967|nr:hypothetical protein [Luteolibacter marinus]